MLRQLLNLQPNDPINRLTERQMADLLYRDSLVLKHSASDHISIAVQKYSAAAAAQAKKAAADGEKRNIRSSPTAAMTVAVVDFLVQAFVGLGLVEKL